MNAKFRWHCISVWSIVHKPFGQTSYQSRTNGPLNAHLTIAQVMPKYNHNNEKQEALL